MTSRFGKTYSRKGGEANSKFDEVFSNKKATLSTKWGETTYKAQLGSKRPLQKPEVVELLKRPRIEDDDSSEDPFGFDSDDESNPVTSHCVPQSEPAEGEASNTPPATTTVPVDNSRNSTATGKQTLSNEGAEKSSQSLYRSKSDSNQKPIAQSSVTKTVPKDPYVEWSLIGTQRSSTSTSMDPLQEKDSAEAPEFSRDSQSSSSQDGLSAGMKSAQQEAQAEPVDNLPPSPFLLRPSNTRKYIRPKPNKASDVPDASAACDVKLPVAASVPAALKPNSVSAASGSGGANASTTAAKPAGRGRVRDYTVLHPSCLSVCNVTIQDSIERSMDELITSTPSTDLRAVGRLRKKADVPPTKPNRFRTTQSKSKKETKLEFFGFEDKGDQEGEDGADPTAGGSSYKIKYFGFDDLSESDSDEEDGTRVKVKRKAKKAAAAAVAAMAVSVDSPQPSDSQDSQSSSNTDILEFSDDSNLGGSEEQKGRSGKQADTSKEIGRKIFSGPKKSPAKAVYNARHWNQPEPEEIPLPPLACAHTAPASISSGSSKDTNSHKDDGLFKAPPPPPKVIKSVTIPTQPYQDIVTALKCRKEHKELYTVVHNVKHFNDVVEFGENQEFTDDFEYLETGLKSSQPLNTRCLSIISLAARCAMPSFRMHLRARGKVAQVFKMLNDAPLHPNLALCTASLMYILSRDRLNMDLDRASLELMIRLLELEHDHSGHHQDQLTAKEMTKVKEKIRKLCETVHNKHLDLENITSCHLAMETLLSLTSKRAGDWFKEELRLLGGLDHIVDKVKECVQNLSQEDDKEKLVSSLWGAERCLRVLDSVTVQNPENQGYLIAYKDSQLIVSSARGLRYCEDMIQRYSREVKSSLCSSGTALPHCSFSNVGKAVEDCMRAVIGVLLNLTHDNEWGSTKTGEQDRLIITALNCVLRVPRYIPQEQRFDIRVLGLGLLINLVEYSARNRHCLVDMEFTSSTSPEGNQGEAGGEETQTPEGIQGEAGGEETQTPEGIQGEAGGEETQTHEGIQGEAGGEETQTPEGIQGEAGGEETQTPEGIQGEAGGEETQTPEVIQGEAGGEETQTHEGIQGEAGGEETQTHEGIQGEAGGEETQTHEGIQGEAGGEETQTPEGIQGEAGGEETQTPEGIQGEAGGEETQTPEGIQGEAGGEETQTPEGIQGEAGGEETQTPEGIQGEAGGEETQTPEGIQGEAGGDQTAEGIQGEAGGEETQTPEGIQGEAGGDETQTPEGIQGEAGGDETQNPEQFLASTDPATAALTEGEAEKKTKGSSSSALAALVQFFLERERAAILAEAQTDDLISEPPKPQDQSGEWQETSGEIQWVAAETNDSENDKEKDIKKDEEDEELDLNKALQHAGKHMEDSIVASYTALLLGCLCQGSQVNVTTVRENLPKGDFSIMTEMLKKFLNFMNLTCAFGTTGHKSISRVIDYLDHC